MNIEAIKQQGVRDALRKAIMERVNKVDELSMIVNLQTCIKNLQEALELAKQLSEK